MSDNSNNHFQIPAGDHQPDVHVDDVLGNVYKSYGSQAEKTVELPIYLQSQTEKLRNIAIVKLQDIGSEIEKARTDRLKSQPIRRIFIKDIAKMFFNQNASDNSYESLVRNELISQESVIGASVFGLKTSDTERHEFFFDGRDENDVDSWFFHQDFGDNNSRTLHYEVLPAGVLLVGTGYLQAEEFNKFIIATEMYHEKVISQIYLDNEIANNQSRSVSSIGKVIKLFNRNDDRGNDRLAA